MRSDEKTVLRTFTPLDGLVLAGMRDFFVDVRLGLPRSWSSKS